MNVALRPEHAGLNLISLCTGGGGLDRAVELAIPDARPILLVERESFAVASLVAQIENGLMAPAAVWSDVRTVPGRQFRGRVDGLIGGIPCQPHSLAGRRGGSTDERDLWSPARRIIAQARPWFVLIENVAGFLSAGADEIPGAARVRRDLRKLGFQSTLVLVRADQMGLPHERLRAFILGVADWFVADGEGFGTGPGRLSVRVGSPNAGASDGGDPLAGSLGAGLEGRRSAGNRPGECSAAERGREHLGDAERARRTAAWRGSILDAGAEPEPRCRDLGDASSVDDQGAGQRGSVRRASRSGQHRGSSPALVHAEGDGRGEGRAEPSVRRGRNPSASDGGAVVHTFGGGRPRRPESPLGEPVGGAAEQQPGALHHEQRLSDADGDQPSAQLGHPGEVRGLSESQGGAEHGSALPGGSRPFLRTPGPGDVDAWRHVALVAPGLLPAVSRYDRLRLEMGAQGFVAAGDPSSGRQSRAQARKARRGAGQGASHWLDAASGDAMGSADVQAAIERALRGVADVMAPRIDELRMLGNGVADAQGALAVRIGVHDLAARGSPGAALLVRMMVDA